MTQGSQSWVERRVLITVKAYPNPSSKYGETVCVAGITSEEGWIRLWPVTYRDLPLDQRFKKYQMVTVRIKNQSRDPRPESFRLYQQTLRLGKVVDTRNGWRLRKEILLPTASSSMCEILTLNRKFGKSLGMFKPKCVQELIFQRADARWSVKQAHALGQLTFFSSIKKRLEKIPYVFKYRYVCDEPKCQGHTQSIIDWEIMELYRKMRDRYQDEETVEQKIRQQFFGEICSPSKETYFFVGNHIQHPRSFMVLGAFYPPKISEAN